MPCCHYTFEITVFQRHMLLNFTCANWAQPLTSYMYICYIQPSPSTIVC